MNWIFWKRVKPGPPSETSSSNGPSLGDVVEFLTENPGKAYIMKSKDAALLWSPRHKAVLCIDGDFDGSDEWVQFEIGYRLHEMFDDDDDDDD
jgi:hypothetical protein